MPRLPLVSLALALALACSGHAEPAPETREAPEPAAASPAPAPSPTPKAAPAYSPTPPRDASKSHTPPDDWPASARCPEVPDPGPPVGSHGELVRRERKAMKRYLARARELAKIEGATSATWAELPGWTRFTVGSYSTPLVSRPSGHVREQLDRDFASDDPVKKGRAEVVFRRAYEQRPEVVKALASLARNPREPVRVRALALVSLSQSQRWTDMRIVNDLVFDTTVVGTFMQPRPMPQSAALSRQLAGRPVSLQTLTVSDFALQAASLITGERFSTLRKYREYRRKSQAERFGKRAKSADSLMGARACDRFATTIRHDLEEALVALSVVQARSNAHMMAKLLRGKVTRTSLLRFLKSKKRRRLLPPNWHDQVPKMLVLHAIDMLGEDEGWKLRERIWKLRDPENQRVACGELAVLLVHSESPLRESAAAGLFGGACGHPGHAKRSAHRLAREDPTANRDFLLQFLGDEGTYDDNRLAALGHGLTQHPDLEITQVHGLIDTRRMAVSEGDTVYALGKVAVKVGLDVPANCADSALGPRHKKDARRLKGNELQQRIDACVPILMKALAK